MMLIYVDKKKERQKKLKQLSLIFLGCFFLIINVIQFNRSLQHTNHSLKSYESIRHLTSWFNNADEVYVFTSRLSNVPAVVLLPLRFNYENYITTGIALSKLSRVMPQAFYLAKVSHNQELKQLIMQLYPQASFVNEVDVATVIVTADYEIAMQQVIRNRLIPLVLNYKSVQKKSMNDKIDKLAAQMFPIPKISHTQIEQEKYALRSFVRDYRETIQNFLWKKQMVDFAEQGIFLQNIRLCLKSNEGEVRCALSENTSLLGNIKGALKQFLGEVKIQSLYLFTSDKLILPEQLDGLTEDEGLHFCYQSREAIILPEELKNLAKITDALYLLKERAGINPNFIAPEMEFYKFKVVEVNADDNV